MMSALMDWVEESMPRNMPGVFWDSFINQARNKKRAAAEATALGLFGPFTSD
jgi:hypothetical protein